ncbi:MAG: hypothetical protein QM729_17090 [Solirubrobacterales bacterium]
MSGETSAISAAAARATIPTEVRKEGSEAVDGYRAALQFEGMLLKQMLTEALPESATAGMGSEEGEEEDAFASNPQATSLPETVTEAIVGAGGLGLAKDLYTSFEGAK